MSDKEKTGKERKRRSSITIKNGRERKRVDRGRGDKGGSMRDKKREYWE